LEQFQIFLQWGKSYFAVGENDSGNWGAGGFVRKVAVGEVVGRGLVSDVLRDGREGVKR